MKPEQETLEYFHVKDQLSLHGGCVLRGSRVVVPVAGRKILLQDLHREHPGMTKMKSLARSYLWWPGMDSDIETCVRTCDECQRVRPDPPRALVATSMGAAKTPWERIHLHYAGPIDGEMLLVIVDAQQMA